MPAHRGTMLSTWQTSEQHDLITVIFRYTHGRQLLYNGCVYTVANGLRDVHIPSICGPSILPDGTDTVPV